MHDGDAVWLQWLQVTSGNILEFQSNRGYDFPLNYTERVAGDPIDSIDRDLLPRAKEVVGERSECREQAGLWALISEIPRLQVD